MTPTYRPPRRVYDSILADEQIAKSRSSTDVRAEEAKARSRDKGGLSSRLTVDDAATKSRDDAEPPTFTEQLQNAVVGEGESIEFRCRVAGKPQPTVQWLFNGDELVASPNNVISFRDGVASLKIGSVNTIDEGEYCCQANNLSGFQATKASLRIKSALLFLFLFLTTFLVIS